MTKENQSEFLKSKNQDESYSRNQCPVTLGLCSSLEAYRVYWSSSWVSLTPTRHETLCVVVEFQFLPQDLTCSDRHKSLLSCLKENTRTRLSELIRFVYAFRKPIQCYSLLLCIYSHQVASSSHSQGI